MLSARDVCKSFGPIVVLDNVSLTVSPSTIHGLIGPNGAGKTTLVNILTGYIDANVGNVTFGGASIDRLPPHRRARLGISRTFQAPRLFEDLTVEANIRPGLPRKARGDDPAIREISEMLGLADDLHRPIKILPAGERRLIEIARSLVGRPSVLLLDEPFAGLSVPEISRVSEIIRKLSKDLQLGVLLIEHNLAAVFALADEVSVLDQGRIIAVDKSSTIATSTAVRQVFFGGDPKRAAGSNVQALPNNTRMAIRVQGLNAGYGRLKIVHDIDVQVKHKETVGLVGVNGAGKSTLLRALAGTIRSSAGTIELHGETIQKRDTPSLVRAGIVLVPEGRHLFPSLTTEDNLRLAGTAAGLSKADTRARLDQLLELFPNVREYRFRPAGALSGGQQQSVAIARALMSRPRVLLLDEPSIGLSRPALDALAPMLQHLINQENISILLAEQNLHFAGLLCARSYLIDGGRIVAEGGADLIATAWERANTASQETEPTSHDKSKENQANRAIG
ncbi:MAG: ATP-binding cassette domain-containing protein [Alphaproteobacteria bacterium]